MTLPAKFRRTISSTFGEQGSAWLERLPELIAGCARRWSLVMAPPFPDLSYNYVAPAKRHDGQEVVLKLGFPRAELTREVEALRYYNGRGSVRLLEAETARGCLLLERLQPGDQLARLWPQEDEQATIHAADVMRQLWRPLLPGHPFKPVGAWIAGLARLRRQFGGGTGPFPERLVAGAEALFAELQASAGPTHLLHGDLHHFNILAAERKPWLAIDPKGVAGEKAYEAGALLRNPVPSILHDRNLQAILARRVAILAERAGLDRRRVIAWAAAQAVLSAWWSYEDKVRDWREIVPLAETLFALYNAPAG